MKRKVLVLGGAGFIGSHLVKKFLKEGSDVTVIDGLLPRTSGRLENLSDVVEKINFINSRIEAVDDLDEIVAGSDFIVDCMAWTSHRAALVDPEYDLQLNLEAHLCFLKSLIKAPDRKVIYLGTRSQYGNLKVKEITEDTPMIPDDIQGVHKLTAESYYKIYSDLKGLNVVSLRFPNCFGENQPLAGDDIGLIGNFVRDLLENQNIEVYGDGRKRHLVYVEDLAQTIYLLSLKDIRGFDAFNVSGYELTIEDLVKQMIEIIGKGTYSLKEIPHEIAVIDMGSAKFSTQKIINYLGEVELTDQGQALQKTIEYFQRNRDDLALRSAETVSKVQN